jgi:hypothetical protein
VLRPPRISLGVSHLSYNTYCTVQSEIRSTSFSQDLSFHKTRSGAEQASLGSCHWHCCWSASSASESSCTPSPRIKPLGICVVMVMGQIYHNSNCRLTSKSSTTRIWSENYGTLVGTVLYCTVIGEPVARCHSLARGRGGGAPLLSQFLP